MLKFTITFALLIATSFTSFAETQCLDVLVSNKSSMNPLTFDQYRNKSLLDVARPVQENWLQYVRIILRMDKQSFINLIPKTTFPKADLKSGKIYFSNMKKGIRQLDPREGVLDYFSPTLFHITSTANSEKILQEGFRLGQGSHNTAAICFGDAGFRKFQEKGSNPILKATLHKDAKILDLTQNPFGAAKASDFSYYDAYEWYKDVFLPSLVKGEYAEIFPELTEHARIYFNRTGLIEYALYSKEAFGLLVGADVLYVSELYPPLRLDEYWVINPEAIKSVERYR